MCTEVSLRRVSGAQQCGQTHVRSRRKNKDSHVMSDLFTSISSGHAGCDPCQRVVGLGGDGGEGSPGTAHVPKARPGSVSVL